MAINQGEGYFLNANVLHHSIAASPSPLELQAQLFDKSILTGARQVVRRYMTTVDNCFRLDAIKLTYASALEGQLLDEIRAAFEAAKSDDGGELLVTAHLNLFWHHLTQRIAPLLMETPEPELRDSIRMKQMLTFIYLHYAEHISIVQVAEATGICERECYRYFSKTLDVTPVAYINSYRIQIASQKLLETDLSVAAISDVCGFSSSSYFVNVFKRCVGCTPAEYRKRR